MKGCIVSLLLAVGSATFGQTNEVETYRAGLFTATNYWEVDVSAFRSQVSTNLVLLRGVRTAEKNAIIRDWYNVVLDLQVPTNRALDYKCWLEEKAKRLSGFPRALHASEWSNLWMRAASFRGELISQFRSMKSIMDEHNARFHEKTITFSNEVAAELWVWDACDRQTARENAAEEMRFGLVEFIGKRNIPLLPSNERWSFYSNFVERACLKETDRAEIRRAIEKKEEKESK